MSRSKLFLSSKQKRALRAIIDNREYGIRNVGTLAGQIDITYSQLANSLMAVPCSEAVYAAIKKFLDERAVKP